MATKKIKDYFLEIIVIVMSILGAVITGDAVFLFFIVAMLFIYLFLELLSSTFND